MKKLALFFDFEIIKMIKHLKQNTKQITTTKPCFYKRFKQNIFKKYFNYKRDFHLNLRLLDTDNT